MYAADAVTIPSDVAGRLRQATHGDAPLLRVWCDEFVAEAGVTAAPGDAIGRRIDAGSLFVWEVDGDVVSMAAVTAPQGDVGRVQLVYTPPVHRKRGYASACVATLTARELAHQGRTCMLYADLANPTSNGIYQAIGYRRVGDAVDLKFATPPWTVRPRPARRDAVPEDRNPPRTRRCEVGALSPSTSSAGDRGAVLSPSCAGPALFMRGWAARGPGARLDRLTRRAGPTGDLDAVVTLAGPAPTAGRGDDDDEGRAPRPHREEHPRRHRKQCRRVDVAVEALTHSTAEEPRPLVGHPKRIVPGRGTCRLDLLRRRLAATHEDDGGRPLRVSEPGLRSRSTVVASPESSLTRPVSTCTETQPRARYLVGPGQPEALHHETGDDDDDADAEAERHGTARHRASVDRNG